MKCSFGISDFLFFFLIFLIILFYFIFKLHNIVLVLPNIEMNPPQVVYLCSPSWTLLPPPSPYPPSGIFLKRSLVFPILLFSCISLHWLLKKAFLSLLAILWNSAFRCLYLSFSPLLFASLLFQLFVRPPKTAILLFCISFLVQLKNSDYGLDFDSST